GPEAVVDHDATTVVPFHAGVLEPETFGVPRPTYGHENDVRLDGLGFSAGGGLHGDRERLLDRLDCGNLGGKTQFGTLLPERALECLGHLVVHPRQDAVEKLDEGDLLTDPPPDRAESEPDDTRTDHQQPLRHLLERKGASG